MDLRILSTGTWGRAAALRAGRAAAVHGAAEKRHPRPAVGAL